MLIALEGLDQSGKETQARLLAERLRAEGRRVETLSFPDYETAIGRAIGATLAGRRDFAPDVLQLLYIANRYEKKPQITEWLAAGAVIVCDRYIASSVAYGESHGLDPQWLVETQRHLPQPDLTILLDIAPQTAVERKRTGRDRYERDLALLERVRASYERQSSQPDWILVNGERDVDVIALDIWTVVCECLRARRPSPFRSVRTPAQG
jgi:dTMP kinase